MFNSIPIASTRHNNRQRGFAYLSTLFLIFLASLLGLAMAAMSIESHRMAYMRRDGTVAFDIAEAGLRHANITLNTNTSYAGESGTGFGKGEFDITVTTPVGQPKYRNVVSESRVTMYNGHVVQRKVSALIDVTIPVVGMQYAMFSDRHMEFSGNAIITSSPEVNAGDIHSNNTMYFSGDPAIAGEGSSSGTVTYSGSPTFTGGMQHNAPTVPFPTFDIAAIKAAATAAGSQGAVTVNGNTVRTLTGKINGKLEVNDNAILIIDGPVWVTDEAILKGRDVRPGPNGGTLLVDQKVTVGGYGGYDPDPLIHNNLKIISTVGGEDTVAFDFSGETKFKAAFIAPNGKVYISGKLDIWGMLIGKKIQLSGEMTVRRNTNYEAGLGEVVRAVIKNWREG